MWRIIIILFVCLLSQEGLVAGFNPATGKSKISQCGLEFVETIPEGVVLQKGVLNSDLVGTDNSLIDLFERSISVIKIVTPYISLTAEDTQQRDSKAAKEARRILEVLISAARADVQLDIVVDANLQQKFGSPEDEKILKSWGSWSALELNKIPNYSQMHSNFIIVDDRHFHLGSAGLDWRSLSQNKQFGVTISRCDKFAAELNKIHAYYKEMARDKELSSLHAREVSPINSLKPLQVKFDPDLGYRMYLVDSLAPENSPNNELSNLLRIIENAQSFIDISMTSYDPIGSHTYWSVLENALKRAVLERNVKVKILFSGLSIAAEGFLPYNQYRENMIYRSLNGFQSDYLTGNMRVKLLRIPSVLYLSPYSRRKQDKYVLTETAFYLSTSDWTEADFQSNANVGLVIEYRGKARSLLNKMERLFDRDFFSLQAMELPRN